MGIKINIGATVDAKAVTDSLNDLLSQWDRTTDRMKRQINEALGGKTEKVVEIQYQVDDSGLKKAVAVERERYSVLDEIRQQYEKETKVAAGSLTNLQKRLATATQLRNATAKYVREVDNGVMGAVKINEKWLEANQQVQQLKAALQQANSSSFFDRIKDAFDDTGISNFFRGLQNVVQAFQAVAVVIQTVTASFDTFVSAQKKIQGLDLTFRSIGQGAQGGARAFQAATAISDNLGVSLDTALNGFKQLTPVVLNSGGTMDDVAKITEALSSRFVAFGKSADESKRILNAVIQAFGKGKLQAEELNQQISEADPAFRTDLASAIGVTTAELEKMVKAGKITAAMLIDILPKMNKTAEIFKLAGLSAEEAARSLGMLDESGNKIGPTLEQITNKIATINQLTLIKVSEEFDKLIKAVFVIQGAFADFFASVADSSAFEAIADLVGDLALGFANVISVVLKVAEIFITLLEPVAEAIKGFSDLGIAGTTLGEIFGTLVAIGITAWLAKMAAESIKNTLEMIKMGAQILLNIGNRGKEVVATNASTASIVANTQAILANKAAAALPGGTTPLLPPVDEIRNLKGMFDKLNYSLFSSIKTARDVGPITQVVVRDLGNVGSAAAGAANGMKLLPPAAGTAGNAIGLLPGKVSLWQRAMQGLQGILGNFKSMLTGLGNAIKSGFGNAINFIANLMKGGFSNSVNLAKNLIGKLGAGFARFGPFVQKALGFLGTFAKGVGAFLTSPIGLAVLAIASVGNVIAMWKTGMKGADAATKQYGAGISGLDKALKEYEKTQQASSGQIVKDKNAWESSVKSVGGFRAAIDTVYRAFGLNTLAMGQNTQTLIGTITQYEKFQSKVASLDQKLKQHVATMGNDNAKKEQARNLLTALNNETNNQIAAEKANLANLKAKIPASKAEAEQIKEAINLTEQRIRTMEAQVRARTKEAAASGLTVRSTQEEIDALKELLEIQKLREELITQQNEAAIEDLKDKWEQEKEAIKQAETAVESYYNKAQQKVEDIKNAESRRHDLAKRQLEDEKLAVEKKYEKAIEKIKEAEEASKKAYDAEIARLKAPTQSEAQLKELEIAELRKQATEAETAQERLKAKAQLERIEADKKAAELEKQRQAEEEAATKREKELEKQKELEIEAIRQKERKEDRDHADRMYAQGQELIKLQREEQAEKEKLRQREEEANKRYGPEIKRLEQEIQAEKAKTEEMQQRVKRAEEDTKGAIDKNTAAQKAHTGAIKDSASAIRNDLIKSLDDYYNKLKNPPKVTIPTAPGRFAGGPVTGGAAYTVNELGKEAFLSNSGRLSWINKPAWGKWMAPGSGTVVPAHIAAGLDIPSGGVSINRANVRTVASGAGGGINYNAMARAIGAALQGTGGPVTNNVTIQSETPVKAASDMLVEMTKIKRRRYS